MNDIKSTLHKIADELPDDATWGDVLYRIVELQQIELGIADCDAGRVTPLEDVMKEFDVSPEWHKDVLNERLEKMDRGEAKFISLEEFKKESLDVASNVKDGLDDIEYGRFSGKFIRDIGEEGESK